MLDVFLEPNKLILKYCKRCRLEINHGSVEAAAQFQSLYSDCTHVHSLQSLIPLEKTRNVTYTRAHILH